MELYLNDNPIGAVALENHTLGDALRVVQSAHCPPGEVIVGVRHNGVDIPGAEMDEALAKPAGQFQKLDLVTAAPARLVADALGQTHGVLDEADAARQATAEHFSAGRIDEGKRALVVDLRVWQQIHEAITQSIRMLDLKTEALVIDGQPLIEVLEKPRQLLVQVKEALAGEDYVMLADILKYEFEDVTEPWRRIIDVLEAKAGGTAS